MTEWAPWPRRFMVQERRGRYLVIDIAAIPPRKRVRSSHATQDVAQRYADTYNEYARDSAARD